MNFKLMAKITTVCFLAVSGLGAGAALAQTKIVLGYTGAAAFLPAFAAKDQGFFDKQGLDVTLQLIPVGSTMPGALVAQSLQVATLTAPVLLLAKDAGLDLGIAAAASYQSKARTTAGAVSRPELALTTANDFKQKRVGVPGLNSVQHILFMKWLQNNGVKADQVTYIEAAFPRMGDMLKGGSIDAALIVEPFLTRVVQTGSAQASVVYGPQVTERYLEAFYAMDKGFVAKNPQVAAKFKAAMAQATKWTIDNEPAARALMVKYLKLPQEVTSSIPLPEFSADVEAADVQQWIALGKEFDLIRSPMKPEQLLF
ncbi:ABC transporter substrate-binding protein [Eoetvoesiella caeni]